MKKGERVDLQHIGGIPFDGGEVHVPQVVVFKFDYEFFWNSCHKLLPPGMKRFCSTPRLDCT